MRQLLLITCLLHPFLVISQQKDDEIRKSIYFGGGSYDISEDQAGELLYWLDSIPNLDAVRARQAASHQGKGWETFTDAALQAVNELTRPVVFILWGAHAQKKAGLIAELVECHPYYVQQLAQLVWLRTGKKCGEETVYVAHESLCDQLGMLFQQITDSLSNTQLNFLRAVSQGVEQTSSSENLKRYNLGTSGNVVRIKEALQNKEIIEVLGNEVVFLDPLYKYWLKRTFSKNK